MHSFFDALFTSEGLGLVVAAIIFLVTIVLIVRRLIGFIFTLILLSFALVSGLVIANNKIVREYIYKESPPPAVVQAEQKEKPIENIRRQIVDALIEIKASICRYPLEEKISDDKKHLEDKKPLEEKKEPSEVSS